MSISCCSDCGAAASVTATKRSHYQLGIFCHDCRACMAAVSLLSTHQLLATVALAPFAKPQILTQLQTQHAFKMHSICSGYHTISCKCLDVGHQAEECCTAAASLQGQPPQRASFLSCCLCITLHHCTYHPTWKTRHTYSNC
jgi:hypothetical protein